MLSLRVSPLTKILFLVMIFGIVVPNLFNRIIGWEPGYWTTLNWFRGHHGGDAWDAIGGALTYLNDHGAEQIYKYRYFETDNQFLYPPQSLFIFQFLIDFFGINMGDRIQMNVVSWYVVFLTAVLSALIIVRSHRFAGIDTACAGLLDFLVRAFVVFLLLLVFFPLLHLMFMEIYSLGSIYSY